jgi:phospholipase C
MRSCATLLLVAGLCAVWGAAARSAVTAASAPQGQICGSRIAATPPRRVKHVVWIFMENKSEGSVVAPGSSSFVAALAQDCGLASNDHSITHPSLPNYLAATSGSTHGVASDCPPKRCSQSGPNLFAQLAAAHKTWRAYVESMPTTCDLVDSSPYLVKHNPAIYYTDVASTCSRWDVPLDGAANGLAHDLAHDSLPSFADVVPNSCDDTHSCPTSAGDDWLRAWVTRIVATPAYRSGQTVVFITWDEGNVKNASKGENCAANPTDESCHVALIALSAWTSPGTVDAALATHYALLKTTEQLLGLPKLLGHAADRSTVSFRSAFRL